MRTFKPKRKVVSQEAKNAIDAQLYFDSLSPWFLETDMEEIEAAYVFSEYGHQNQLRDDGTPYFEHPKAVSRIIFFDWDVKGDWHVIGGALIHDVQEDQRRLLSERRLIINFGKTFAMTVKLVSKDINSVKVFMVRLKSSGDWRAVLIKIADRVHNMRTLDNCKLQKQKEQLKETRLHFFELCDILEKIIPKDYSHAVDRARKELDRLCTIYEKKFAKQ